jgi:parvulin-like peptidyl-prolyl isomerase
MRRVAVIFFLVLALVGVSCSTFAVAAATVNGRKITESQVESELDRVRADPTFQDLLQRQADQLRGVARRNILTGLIRQQILSQEAAQRGIRVSQRQVDRLIAQEAQRQGLSVEDFRKAQNLSEADARVIGERIVRQFELRNRVIRDVKIDSSRIRSAYEAQKEAFVEFHVFRITVKTEQDARRAIREINGAATFEEVARRRSTDNLADKGGDMGFVPMASLSSQAQSALESAGDGDVAEPVASSSGFEIYRRTDRRSQDLDEVRDELRAQLGDQAREQQFEDWLGRRLRDAAIVVNPKYGRFDRQTLQIVPGRAELRP